MLSIQHTPTEGVPSPDRSTRSLSEGYACTEDSGWTKPPHRGAKANGVALRRGDGDTPDDHRRRETHEYPDSRLRVDRPLHLSVNHHHPADGPRWAETLAGCGSESASRVDACDQPAGGRCRFGP